MPLAQSRGKTADLIIHLKGHITSIGSILAIDQGTEAIAVLDLDGRIHAANESVWRIFWDCEQSWFILGLSTLHDWIAQVEYIAS